MTKLYARTSFSISISIAMTRGTYSREDDVLQNTADLCKSIHSFFHRPVCLYILVDDYVHLYVHSPWGNLRTVVRMNDDSDKTVLNKAHKASDASSWWWKTIVWWRDSMRFLLTFSSFDLLKLIFMDAWQTDWWDWQSDASVNRHIEMLMMHLVSLVYSLCRLSTVCNRLSTAGYPLSYMLTTA